MPDTPGREQKDLRMPLDNIPRTDILPSTRPGAPPVNHQRTSVIPPLAPPGAASTGDPYITIAIPIQNRDRIVDSLVILERMVVARMDAGYVIVGGPIYAEHKLIQAMIQKKPDPGPQALSINTAMMGRLIEEMGLLIDILNNPIVSIDPKPKKPKKKTPSKHNGHG